MSTSFLSTLRAAKHPSVEADIFLARQGGNFIDTANTYQNEESELWLGEWMESRGVRDEMIIATKVSSIKRSDVGKAC